MRISLFFKIAALVVLGITSSVITSTLMTRSGLAQSAPPDGDSPTNPQTIVKISPPLAPNQQVAHPGLRSVAGGTLKLTDVEVAGNEVHLAATALIRDTRPNMRFIWSVRVIDPADETAVLFEKLYNDQIFGLPEQGELAATFEDRLAIPVKAGKYHLELTWFGIHPQSGLAGLDDPVIRRRFKGASGIAPIVLQP